jgi:hypothetical protein
MAFSIFALHSRIFHTWIAPFQAPFSVSACVSDNDGSTLKSAPASGDSLSATCAVLRPESLFLHFSVLSEPPAATIICLFSKSLPEESGLLKKCRQSRGLSFPVFHLPLPLFVSSFLGYRIHIPAHSLTHSTACVKSNTHGHSSSNSAGSWN